MLASLDRFSLRSEETDSRFARLTLASPVFACSPYSPPPSPPSAASQSHQHSTVPSRSPLFPVCIRYPCLLPVTSWSWISCRILISPRPGKEWSVARYVSVYPSTDTPDHRLHNPDPHPGAPQPSERKRPSQPRSSSCCPLPCSLAFHLPQSHQSHSSQQYVHPLSIRHPVRCSSRAGQPGAGAGYAL